MASKERGGLSKREYAAKIGGTVKSSSNSSSSSTLKAPKAPKIKEFKFDSSKLLPQYQQEAASLYAPQLQQLSQLREITKGQAEEAKVRTNADFARLLEREKESINQRGAFFGGGAVDRENRIGAEQGYALRGIEQQAQLQNLDYDTTQGNIGQAQKDYVAGKVEGAFSSAYQTFRDKVSDAMSKYQMELGQYNTDREFEQNKIESDRQYALSAAASGRAGANAAQTRAQSQILADAQGKILGSRGQDGKADPGVYAEQKAAYIRSGGNPADFDSAFGGALSDQERSNLSVTYGTAAKAPLQYQYAAANYGTRAETSSGILNGLESKVSTMNPASFEAQKNAVGKPFVNAFVGKDIQSYDQASRDFITAVLRKESGAQISPTEFAMAYSQYLPVPGDNSDTINQKKQNRSLVIENLRNEAGNAWNGTAQSSQNVNKSTPTIKAWDINGDAVLVTPEEMASGNYRAR